MKHGLYSMGLLLLAAAFSHCSKNEAADQPQEDVLAIAAMQVSLPGMISDGDVQTKAIGDFVVNTDLDTTADMTGRTAWTLNVTLYSSAGVVYNQQDYSWDTTEELWVPADTIFFPNYLNKPVAARLTPPGWSNVIATDQSSADLLYGQDVLVQNASSTLTINPAHIPVIRMRHQHSMLDFILDQVEEADIASVRVYAGGKEYIPYRVTGSDELEYQLILPTGVTNPVVRINTVGGARYERTLAIASTAINTCYCAHMKGLELLLTTITISDWIYGSAVAGQYSTETSYPTFRGPANESLRVVYNNGLSQELTFNDRGEVTIKATGRTIVQIIYQGRTIDLAPDEYIVLRNMVIDLSQALLIAG